MSGAMQSWWRRGSVVVGAVVLGCQFPKPPDIESEAGPVARYEVTLVVGGAGAGTVRVEPGDFVCASGTCTREFDAGSELVVTATGASELDGVQMIAGDCAASPCTLSNLSGPRAVNVSFARFQCVPGAAPRCEGGLFTQCGDDGNFVSYTIPDSSGEGTTAVTMDRYECPMGCHADGTRCADIDAGSVFNPVLDEVSDSSPDIVLPRPGSPAGTITLDTVNGFDSALGQVRIADTSGSVITIPAVRIVQAAPAPQVVVLKTRTFTLRAGSTLRMQGSRALGIVAHRDIVIAGTMDLSADPPGIHGGEGAGSIGSPNGCAGQFVDVVSGGGGHGCVGGRASNGALGGSMPALPTRTVHGGCSGGAGPGLFQFPGGGGGGLMLVSRSRVVLTGASVLDASGGGGWGASSWASGGGSGGQVLIQTPALSLAAGAVVAGRGGSGGAASGTTSAHGVEGPVSGSTPAPGATCSGCGVGGPGGVETGSCSIPSGMGSGSAIGAGGGAAGQCTAYTRIAPTVPAGMMKIRYQYLVLASRSQ
jgi:hypothetical protein